MNNYILVPRKVFKEGVFGKPEPYTRREAFIDLVQMAAYEDREYFINGTKYHLSRGQIIASKLFLATRWEWSKDKVRRFLEFLEKNEWCICSNDKQITIISIVNYESFQGTETTEEPVKKERKKQNEVPTDADKNLEVIAMRIYDLYPKTTTRGKGKVYIRSNSDVGKIVSLLKKGFTEEELSNKIKRYISEHPSGEYLKNLSTFLNNLPDYSEEPKPQEQPKQSVTISQIRKRFQGEKTEQEWQAILPAILAKVQKSGYLIINDE